MKYYHRLRQQIIHNFFDQQWDFMKKYPTTSFEKTQYLKSIIIRNQLTRKHRYIIYGCNVGYCNFKAGNNENNRYVGIRIALKLGLFTHARFPQHTYTFQIFHQKYNMGQQWCETMITLTGFTIKDQINLRIPF